MTVLFVLRLPARFVEFRSHFKKVFLVHCVRKRVQCCFYTKDINVDHPGRGLERYKELQSHFKRHLKATYSRFANVPDHSAVFGRHHIYFLEADGIYRTEKKPRKTEPEQVLNLGCITAGEEIGEWTVQRIRLSPQEKHLAATLKKHATEKTRCVIVTLGQRDILTLDDVFSFEWATDEVLFYTLQEGLKCQKVYRLDLTKNGSMITSVYQELQPDVFVEVSLSRDRQVLIITCSSRSSSEVMLVDVTNPHLEPTLVQARQPELLYHVEHWRQNLIILANTGPGQEYQVVKAPLSKPSMVSWDTVFTPRSGTVLKDMDVVGEHCILLASMANNELELIVVPLSRPMEAYSLQLPFWACVVESKRPGLADQLDTFKFLISSPVRPPVLYRLYAEDGHLSSGTEDRPSCFQKQQRNYITKRLTACSKDGTFVPVTLLHSVECKRDTPLLVHVYGAYGQDVNMQFCPVKRFLLDQGWALAYCHIRGGGECGLAWQRQARVEGKHRGVEDLRACLSYLFSSGVSSPLRTVLTACSAGAVPVGALCNVRPDMMRAVILQSPFLDVLGTMEDPKLPLTVEDREEWGNPVENPEHMHTIASYCPVHNITPQRYPSMLLTASTDDDRTPLAGVLKYAKKLKEAAQTHSNMVSKSDAEPNIVVNIQPGANHTGPDGWESMLEEEALRLAFLYNELDLDPPRHPRRRKI
ncbi:prolyl endopeptidase-like isoform X2 [Corythoichthys intestinalis]|uniref:prolyl endopeptidase-like isoform X2 n=1 Tax=Corythoichthys intestinalis TaxID=161448 RepID=UPI0025A5E5D5|nr:prolyl endopeptidase-like isoform X2 [Corythoichthys intestinalis]XP_061794092.1 prolyl endopeptidase-like [Nerophis lumbriciformis]